MADPELKVQEQNMADTAKLLDECQTTLDELSIPTLATGYFGGSSAGLELGQHCELTRAAAIKVLKDSRTSLLDAGENLTAFNNQVTYADEDAKMRVSNLITKLGLV